MNDQIFFFKQVEKVKTIDRDSELNFSVYSCFWVPGLLFRGFDWPFVGTGRCFFLIQPLPLLGVSELTECGL